MPGGDGTGPFGSGPATGRGAGLSVNQEPMDVLRRGRGRGGGGYRRRRRGCPTGAWGWQQAVAQAIEEPNDGPDTELHALQVQVDRVSQVLIALNERIQRIESAKKKEPDPT